MIRLALIGWPDNLASIAQAAMRLRGGRFTAVLDTDVHKAENLARSLGATIWTESFEKLQLDHSQEFDAIVWLYTAFQKPVVAAKPMLTSMTEAARIAKASVSQHPRVMAAHVSRFLPAVRVVKESLDAGKLGEAGLLRIHRWAHETTVVPKRKDAPFLVHDLVNEIDLANWLFDKHPTEIYAVAHQPPEPAAPQGYWQLHLGFAGGGMALIDCAYNLRPGGAYSALSLIGSKGAAYADEHHNMQLLVGGGRPLAIPTRPDDGYLLPMLQEFINALAGNREPSVTGADAVAALEVVEAASASLTTGQAQHRLLSGPSWSPA